MNFIEMLCPVRQKQVWLWFKFLLRITGLVFTIGHSAKYYFFVEPTCGELDIVSTMAVKLSSVFCSIIVQLCTGSVINKTTLYWHIFINYLLQRQAWYIIHYHCTINISLYIPSFLSLSLCLSLTGCQWLSGIKTYTDFKFSTSTKSLFFEID